MWPINTAVTQSILQTDFFANVERAQNKRFFPRLSTPKTVDQITTSFPSFGSVPEIRQFSAPAGTATTSGGGVRQAVPLKDYSFNGTVYEWEQTVPIRRLLATSKPQAVRDKTAQIASKAMKGMDRALCQGLVASNVGYDGVALLSTAHAESGSNQSNLVTGANITTNYVPTATEAEAMLMSAIPGLLAFVDDQGTPVNEGVTDYILLCPIPMYIPFKLTVDPTLSQQAIDSSGITGRFRGMVEVIPSAYATTTGFTSGTLDRIFVFPKDMDSGGGALALATLADWQFNTNIGDESSDDWNNGMGYLRSWAAFGFFPWNWHSVMCHIVT